MRIGCFHAHYSNIELIEQALNAYDVELIHYVDPGLDRIKKDTDFHAQVAEKKVQDTLTWIAQCHADAILITCTYFAAVLQGEQHALTIPVVTIDDPLFQDVCRMDRPVIMVFTNPSTVQGTLHRLALYSQRAGTELQVEHRLLDHTFELIMQGRQAEYKALVAEGLTQIATERLDAVIVAAQLSMAAAAWQVEQTLGVRIGNPLAALASHMEQVLLLQRKL